MTDLLANLEQGHLEAQDALRALRDAWIKEDEARIRFRAYVLEAHAQGARDRDAMRVQLGGVSLLNPPPTDPEVEADAAAVRRAADKARDDAQMEAWAKEAEAKKAAAKV